VLCTRTHLTRSIPLCEYNQINSQTYCVFLSTRTS
jgi:hypothetical protein